MSVRMMTLVFDRYPNGGGERVLALAIADHAHDDGTHIFPSVQTLAGKSLQSERTVQYQLRKMVKIGWLIQVYAGGGRNRPAEYRINPDWIKGANLAPFSEDEKGCNPEQERVQSGAETVQPDVLNGATAIAPEPSEPSINQEATEESESARARLRGGGVPDDLIERWLQIRTEKDQRTAAVDVEAVAVETSALGITLSQAIKCCCERGWANFTARWYERFVTKSQQAQIPKPQKPSAGGDWRDSMDGIRTRGAELGIERGQDESDDVFRKRVLDENWKRQQRKAAEIAAEYKGLGSEKRSAKG